VQIYEILFLVLVGIVVSRKWRLPEGARFRIFLGSYLAWRIVIDFLKPQPLVAGMNVIQWAAVGGIFLLVLDWAVGRREALATVRA
jgi:prolipoprotein diacylglyceryltransferase